MSNALSREGLEVDFSPSVISEVTIGSRTQAIVVPPTPAPVPRVLDVCFLAYATPLTDYDFTTHEVYVPCDMFDKARITVYISLGSTTRTYTSEYWDGAAWQPLGVAVVCSSSGITDSGLTAITAGAIAQGWCKIRVSRATTGAGTNVPASCHLTFTNAI